MSSVTNHPINSWGLDLIQSSHTQTETLTDINTNAFLLLKKKTSLLKVITLNDQKAK